MCPRRTPLVDLSRPGGARRARLAGGRLRRPDRCSAIGHEPGRLLPPPRQEAQAVPDHARRATVAVGDGAVTTYTFGQDLYDDMLAAIEGAQRQILFETYIWKGDEVGERFKAGAHRRGRPRASRSTASTTRSPTSSCRPRFKRFPPIDEGAALPRLRRRAGGSSTCAATAATTARSWSSTTRSGSSAATTSASAYATEWRDTHCRITGPGVWDLDAGLRRLLEPAPAPAGFRHQRAAAAAGDRLDLGAADPGAPQRAAAVDVPDPGDVPRGDQPGPAQRLDDPRLLHPRPGLRRRARWTPPGAGSTYACCCRAKSNHIVADWISRGYFRQLLDAGVADLPLPRRDGARQDRDHRRQLVDDRHRQHRPAQPCRATTRSTSRSSTPALAAGDGADLRDRPRPTALPLTMAEWEARDVYTRFTETILVPLRPLLLDRADRPYAVRSNRCGDVRLASERDRSTTVRRSAWTTGPSPV